MIVASAVKTEDGKIFVGRRHGEAQRNAYKILGIETSGDNVKPLPIVTDGFITADLRFLEREEALVYAKEIGQFKQELHERSGYDGPQLFSEDLW